MDLSNGLEHTQRSMGDTDGVVLVQIYKDPDVQLVSRSKGVHKAVSHPNSPRIPCAPSVVEAQVDVFVPEVLLCFRV